MNASQRIDKGAYRRIAWAAIVGAALMAGGPTVAKAAPTSPSAAPAATPELPRVWLNTKLVATTGRTIPVKAGDDLQAALDAVKPGDTLTLEAGATWAGNFTLPAKANPQNRWIVIRTAALGGIAPEGRRLDPAKQGAALPKILSNSAMPALNAAPTAHHYRLIGIEFGITPSVTLNYDIVRFGEGTETQASQTPHDIIVDRCSVHGAPLAHAKRGVLLNGRALAVIDSDIREIHGLGQDTQAISGFNGPGPFKIANNELEGAAENVMFGGAPPAIPNLVPSDIEIRGNHFDKPPFWRQGVLPAPQGVTAQGAPGGTLASNATVYYRVSAWGRAGYNNETEVSSPASPEVAVAPGAGPGGVHLQWTGPGWVPEYRVYRTSDAPAAAKRTWHFYRVTGTQFTDAGAAGGTEGVPPEGGPTWSVKNLFELKNARRVLFDGNVLEHHWPNAQAGPAILFTVRTEDGAAPQAVVEDVTFTHNILRHSSAAFNILGQDGNPKAPGQTQRILVRGNLFYDIGGPWGGSGTLLLMTGAARHIAFERNTSVQRGTLAQIAGPPHLGFVFRNNIVRNGEYGFKGDGTGTGNSAIEAFFTDPAKNVVFTGNTILGGDARWYPAGNVFPADEAAGFRDAAHDDYRLRPDSPLRGKALGADPAALQAATRGAVSGVATEWASETKKQKSGVTR